MEVNETKITVYPRFSPPVPIFFLGSEFNPGGLADGKVVVGGCGGIRRLPNSPHPNIPSRREAIFLPSGYSHFTHKFFYSPEKIKSIPSRLLLLQQHETQHQRSPGACIFRDPVERFVKRFVERVSSRSDLSALFTESESWKALTMSGSRITTLDPSSNNRRQYFPRVAFE